MLQLCFIFACMKVNSTYRKIAAALLLLCMLLTSVVQLLHSHPAKQTAAVQIKKISNQPGKKQYSLPGPDNRCFLCEYQLTKDADIDHSVFYFTAVAKLPVTAPVQYEYNPAAFNSCFETRGPPAAIV